MGLAETAELAVKLTLSGNFASQLRTSQSALGKFDARLDATGTRAFRAGQQIGTGIRNGVRIGGVALAGLISQVGAGLNQLSLLEDQTLATNAAIASTKGVAGISAAEVRRLAEEYENLNATIDDKAIQAGENLLLTFTNVRKQAFEPALEAALNMSVAMKQDLNTSVLQLGKALNDPIRGMTALRRVGVQFTAQQEDQIKALVKSGDLLGAQKIILKELGTEFGGRFAAAGKGARGTIAGIGDAVEDLQKSLATALFPTVQKLLPRLRELLTSKGFTDGAERLGKSIADLFSEKNLKAGGDILREVFQTAKDAAPTIAAAAKITAEVVKSAVGLFRSLPPEMQKLAIGAFAINKLTGGLVTNIAGGLISSVLKQLVSGVVNVSGGVVNVVGASGIAPPSTTGASKGSKAASIASTLGKVFIVGAAIGVFAELKGILDEQTTRNKAQADALVPQLKEFTKNASTKQLQTALNGIEAQIAELARGTSAEGQAFIHNIDGVRDSIVKTRNDLKAELARQTIQTTESGRAALVAGDRIRAAIFSKNFSPTVNVTVKTQVSLREISFANISRKSIYRVAS